MAWRVAAFVFISALLGIAHAQPFWAETNYDSDVPTVDSVLGFAVGDRIFSHAEIVRYMEALADAAPDRMRLARYGTSWEGRDLVYVAIGSKENIAGLDAIQSQIRAVADPRITKTKEARTIVETLPATVWLGYSIHGNEISGSNAALQTAYHLLAGRGDALVGKALENTIIFIDPLQNPDGRDRFVHHFYQHLGLMPDENPLAAEHNEPWPSGRTNHYLFDLNRDWFALTQPESIGRIRTMQVWLPLVVADLHEMGYNDTYYFPPPALPHNPHLTTTQKAHLEGVGRNNAKWFDRFGIDYFTREVYDAFYPGYGDSQPAFYGAVAMTFEQASASGLVIRRTAGNDLHFRDGVRNHFVASMGTIEYAADNREQLWRDFYDYRNSAIEEGRRGKVSTYILPNRGDQAAVAKMAGILVEQGVEVYRSDAPERACGQDLPAGSYFIPLAQPAKRFIRTLLDPEVPLDTDFIKEQERLRAKKLPDEIYDITAWSLPLAYNVELVACSSSVGERFKRLEPGFEISGSVEGANARVAYLAPWGSASAGRLLAESLRAGLHVLSANEAFVQEGRNYPAGTLIFKTDSNPADLREQLVDIATRTGADVAATDTSWVDEGPNFGSENVVHVPAPKIALVWDTPTASYNAGATRFVIERQFNYPVTPVPADLIAKADLTPFNVLILPDTGVGSYADTFGESGAARIVDWVEDGGLVIAIGNAVKYLIDPGVALLNVLQEEVAPPPPPVEAEGKLAPVKPEPEEGETRVAGTLLDSEDAFKAAIQAEEALPDSVAGVLVRANVDGEHWLGAGVAKTVNVMVQGRNIFTPVTLDKGVNVAYFSGPDDLLASGYLWEENRKQLAYKPFAIAQPHGRGVVVAFTADPCFRAYMDGLNTLFLNAVFRGPAHARRLVSESTLRD